MVSLYFFSSGLSNAKKNFTIARTRNKLHYRQIMVIKDFEHREASEVDLTFSGVAHLKTATWSKKYIFYVK